MLLLVPLSRDLELMAKSGRSFESGLDTTSIARPNGRAEGEAIPVTTSKAPQPDPLVPLRSALIVLIAIIIGGVLGGLTFWANQSLPQALFAGLAGAAGALLPLDKMIGR